MVNSKAKSLLDTLAEDAECTFLSDLHHPALLPLVRQIVSGYAPRDYPLEEWTEAARYITGRSVSFSCAEDAKAYLSPDRRR